MTDGISSAPPLPPYDSVVSNGETKCAISQESQRYPESGQLLQQPQYSLPPRCGFPSMQSPVEPIIMPVVMPQQSSILSYPCQQSTSDKPVNVVVNNANSKADGNSLTRDYRICRFCKCGIMKKKKDWLRIIAILLLSLLCPPFSLLCCIFLCTNVIYFGECSACHRISKKEHKVF